jgi:hypothetical protein
MTCRLRKPRSRRPLMRLRRRSGAGSGRRTVGNYLNQEMSGGDAFGVHGGGLDAPGGLIRLSEKPVTPVLRRWGSRLRG